MTSSSCSSSRRTKLPRIEKSQSNLAALGFLTINDYFLGDRSLQIDDRIDVVSRGMLGITIGCARCHDHKYDPIASKDYYALYSVFNSCEQPGELPVIGQPADKAARDEFQRKVAEVESKKQAFRLEVMDDLRKPQRLGGVSRLRAGASRRAGRRLQRRGGKGEAARPHRREVARLPQAPRARPRSRTP